MFEPKIPLVGAVVGFALSFLIGLISGAVFHLILVRALVMAFLFGGIAFACSSLIGKFLPELLSGEAVPEMRDPAMGTMVDVTLGDGSDAVAAFGDGSAERLPDFMTARSGVRTSIDDVPTDVEDVSPGDFVPGLPVSGSYSSASGAERSTGEGKRQMGEAASSVPGTGHLGRASMPVTADGLDILPDLQDFIPASRPETDDNPDSAAVGLTGSSVSSASQTRASQESPGAGVESATMVKAIRTLLARDS